MWTGLRGATCASRQASWRHRAEWQLFYRQRRSQKPSGDPPTGPSRPRAPLCSALRGRHRHSITLCESPDLLSPPHVPPTHAKKRGRGVTTLLCSLEQAQRFINQTHSNTKSSAKTYRGKRRHYNLSLRLRLRLRLRRLHLRQLVQREVVRRNACKARARQSGGCEQDGHQTRVRSGSDAAAERRRGSPA